MKRLTDNKIVLVTRKTRLDDIITQFNTLEQAKFYIQHLGSDFTEYQNEDYNYKKALFIVEETLRALGNVQVLERTYLPNFVFNESDTVVVLGQDGLVANTLKYLKQNPVIAINPDPTRWDGALLPFTVDDTQQIVLEVFAKTRSSKSITFAKASLQDGQVLYAVNDLFIGPKSHTSARYEISINDEKEFQSSSGIIISTGLGSTGWLSSVIAGARGINGLPAELTENTDNCGFEWSANYLKYSVREPFPSKTTGTSLVFGTISSVSAMKITSFMSDNGVIFSDGIESDFLAFNSGFTAIIGVAEKEGNLIV